MIQLFECPTCGKPTSTFTLVTGTCGDKLHCPACVPVPDKTPHNFTPVMVGGLMLEQADVRAERLYNVNLVSGFCCGDASDCGHPCGIA